jgi:hypothetical protein
VKRFTICYLTNRRDCRWEWFHDTLMKQAGERAAEFKLVVVDFHAAERPPTMTAQADIWTAPKPSVWQGPHRLTTKDYFAPSNARNTGLCFAEGSHVVFADDLSALMPGWFDTVYEETNNSRVVLGRYTKVIDVEVRDGEVVNYLKWANGEDHRYRPDYGPVAVKAGGGWMYGASVCLPIEAILSVNGFDEDCDSMGGEDYAAGIMMEARGWEIIYHQGMWTIEDEMLHHVETPFTRMIKHKTDKSRFVERDASLHYLGLVKYRGRDRAPNYCDLRALREHILAGGEFPVSQIPQHDWRDGQPLCEM